MRSAFLRIDAGVWVGPYLVERRLAHNAASTLYAARAQDGGLVVLRVVQPEAATDVARARLKREARALAGVDHPGVVRVRDVGEHDGMPWVAMAYVHGTDLEHVLSERGPMSTEVALGHATQAAEALVAAHDAGAVHREIEPSNLLLTPDGRIVLVDFGIGNWSDRHGPQSAGDSCADASAYAAPEQIEHGLVDERSDVWAIGCVLYEMVVGAPPFGRGGSVTAAAILRHEPVFPADASRQFMHIVNGCLRKNSFARIASARELAALLRDGLDDPRSREAPDTDRASMQPSVRPGVSAWRTIPPPPRLPSMLLPGLSSRSSSSAISGPPASVTRVAAGRGRIKGTALRPGIAWFGDVYGSRGLARVVELASPELRAILRPKDPVFGFIAAAWYDTQLVGELVELIERVASPSHRTTFGSSVGEAIAHNRVTGVHRAFFRLVSSPSLLEANAQRVWRAHVDEGKLSVGMRSEGAFEAQVRGWSHHHPSVCRMLRAMLETSLRAVGYTGLVLERTQCVALGDRECAFRGTWNV